MSKLMISSSGLRGIVGVHMTPKTIEPFVRAFLAWCPQGKIVLGGDTRTSHDALAQLVASICQLCGRDVVMIGQVPTPTVQQTVRDTMAAGGFAITASHNPVAWNGLKIIDSTGSFLSSDSFESFYQLYNDQKLALYQPWDAQGKRVQDPLALSRHIKRILHVLPTKKIRTKRVLIDVNHGAACKADRELFKALGISVDFLYDSPDGQFSHPPEPLESHLTTLCDRMKSGNYDIGFAQDPDADRLVIVDECGRFIGEDYSLAFCMDYYMAMKNDLDPTIVVNLSTSMVIRFIAQKYGARLVQSKVGEPNVTAKMKETNALIGGEGNGGVICPAIGWGRDSLTGIVLALLHLSTRQQTVSQIVSQYPQYVMIRDKQPLESNDDIDQKLHRVIDYFLNQPICNEDGVKVSFESSWVHIRPSNTEPIVRIFAEAESEQAAIDLIETVKSI